MYPGHRGMGGMPPNNSQRLNELIEQIRAEFESQLRASETYENHSTIFLVAQMPAVFVIANVLAVQTQINEMQLVREKVYSMEQTHMALKQK